MSVQNRFFDPDGVFGAGASAARVVGLVVAFALVFLHLDDFESPRVARRGVGQLHLVGLLAFERFHVQIVLRVQLAGQRGIYGVVLLFLHTIQQRALVLLGAGFLVPGVLRDRH